MPAVLAMQEAEAGGLLETSHGKHGKTPPLQKLVKHGSTCL